MRIRSGGVLVGEGKIPRRRSAPSVRHLRPSIVLIANAFYQPPCRLRSRQIHGHALTHSTQVFCSTALYIQSNPVPSWNTYVFRCQQGQPSCCPELAHWEVARTRSPCAQCALSVHSHVLAAGLNSGMRRPPKMPTRKMRISLMPRRKEKEGPRQRKGESATRAAASKWAH